MISFQRRLLSLLLTLLLGACSHGIIEQDAVISPDGGGGGIDTMPVDNPPAEKAGDASEGTLELRTIYFGFDSYVLRKEAVAMLRANARHLKDHPDINLQIEGHCDQRGTVQYNLALGERRAQAVRHFLIGEGVAASRMTVISYGKERPEDPSNNEKAWAKNRRAISVKLE